MGQKGRFPRDHGSRTTLAAKPRRMRANPARVLWPPPPSIFLYSKSRPKIKRNLGKRSHSGKKKAKEANRMANKRRNASFFLQLDAVLSKGGLELAEGHHRLINTFGEQRGGENSGDVPGDTAKQVVNPLADRLLRLLAYL